MALPKKGYKPGIYRFVSGTVDGNGDFSITNIPKDGYVSGIYQLTEVTIDADGNTSVEEDDIGITAAIEVTVDGSGDLSVTEVPEEGYVSGVYRVTTSTNIPKEGFNQIDFSAVIGTISGGKWESGPGIQFNAALTNSLIPSSAVAATYTFARADTDATVTDFEGLVKDVTADEARFVGARRDGNLATGLVTETITVISGSEYQVTIAGGSGDTCVASGAFTGTLTANGTNRISWNSGTPKTAASTSLTLTITGTLTELLVEEVTGQANQNPSENVAIGAEHGTNAGNVKYFNYQNNNTVDGSGIVTEATGAAISAATLEGVLVEEAQTNVVIQSGMQTGYTAVNGGVLTLNDSSHMGGFVLNTVAATGGSAASGVQGPAISTTSNATYTIFAYLKKGTSVRPALIARDTTAPAVDHKLDIDWSGATPTIFSTAAIIAGSVFIQLVNSAEGVYRIGFSYTLDATGTFTRPRVFGDATGSNGNVHISGIQIVTGTLSTSYIPTTTGAVTRNAESLSYPNTNILDDEGTLAITFTPSGSSAQYTGAGDRALVGVRGVNADLLHIDTTTGKLILSDGTNETVPTTLTALVAGTATKIAIRWSATAGTMQIRQDAVEVSATFDGSMNKSTALRIGYSGANRANGTYKNLIVYNGAVNDATFTGLTA